MILGNASGKWSEGRPPIKRTLPSQLPLRVKGACPTAELWSDIEQPRRDLGYFYMCSHRVGAAPMVVCRETVAARKRHWVAGRGLGTTIIRPGICFTSSIHSVIQLISTWCPHRARSCARCWENNTHQDKYNPCSYRGMKTRKQEGNKQTNERQVPKNFQQWGELQFIHSNFY